MFSLDGDVLQQALQEEDSRHQQVNMASSAEGDKSPRLLGRDVQLEQASEGDVRNERELGEIEGRRRGIIEDLPAAIRLNLMSDAEATTLPPLPLYRSSYTRTSSRKAIPTGFRTVKVEPSFNSTPNSDTNQSIVSQVQQTQGLTPLESRSVTSEPEMMLLDGIPGLIPPPAFQERFKYIVCSSGLLKDRPNFDIHRNGRTESSAALDDKFERPTISLAGLGIENVTIDHGDVNRNDAAPETNGLRRRNVPSCGQAIDDANPPASFRRPSGSSVSASTPLTPVFQSMNEYPSTSGWLFLAYTPIVRSLSPYAEPIVLLLSSLLWIFQIVGCIWLEIVAICAIVFCGFANIIVRMSKEEKRSRDRVRTRRSRRTEEATSIPADSKVIVEKNELSVTAEQPKCLSTSRQALASTLNEIVQSDHDELPRAKGHDGSTSVTATQPGQQGTCPANENDTSSLQGLALETLQTVVQEAEEMDEVIGNALTTIRDSERSSSYAGANGPRMKRLRQSLHTAFTALNDHLSEAYASLAPLVSLQELHTFEVMYGLTDNAEAAGSSSPHSTSLVAPLPLRSPLAILLDSDRTFRSAKRISSSEYSTTSTSVEDDKSNADEETQRRRGYHAAEGTPAKRSRTRSSLSYQATGQDAASRNTYSFHGPPGDGANAVVPDRFSPLPARSPRLAHRQNNGLKRASSLKEKASSGTIRPSTADDSADPSAYHGEMRRLRYSWRYPSTLQEESESAQSLFSPHDDIQTNAGTASPTFQHTDENEQQMITIPARPKGQLRELRLSQSGIGSASQTTTPLLSSSLSPQFASSRTPDDRPDFDAYFQVGHGGLSRISPMILQRKPSSLQNLRYRNPDGTTVTASSPAKHHRTRSSVDVTHANLDHFIGDLPPAVVSGLRYRGRAEGDNKSDSSPLVSDRNSLPGCPRPLSSTGYASSPTYPTFFQPRLQRATSFSHLTLASLKASLLAVHLKRKRMACALLALDFAEDLPIRGGPTHIYQIALAKYWADVHMILDGLRRSLSSITNDIKAATIACKDAGYEPFLPGRPHDSFAPRQSDQFIMLEQIHILSRLLAGAQNELIELRSSVEQGDKQDIIQQWDQLRMDLAAMIRTWEKGRTTAGKSSVPLGNELDPELPNQVPEFVRHWDVEGTPALDNQEADTSNDASTSSPVPDESSPVTHVNAYDDATKHLLDSTSASLLPPPGIEDVFEALLDRPTVRSSLTGPDGKKLSREERIRLVKLAREGASGENSESNVKAGPLSAASTTMAKNGQVMDELKSVIGEMKRRRTTESPG